MQPDIYDVQQLVTALFALKGSLEKAERQNPQAHALTVLYVIAMHPGINPKAIAVELDLHPSSITRQVQSLEDDGYVAVVANEEDRRSCRITLTDAGLQELQRLTRIGLDRFALFVADWEAEEVRTLTRLLSKLEASKAQVSQNERAPKKHSWQQES